MGQQPVGVYIAPADPADVANPDKYVKVETTPEEQPAPAKAEAAGGQVGSNRVAIDSDPGEEDQEKFNPTLIQNNPKAHAYAEQLRGAALVELGVLKRVVDLTPEELAKCTAIAQDDLFKVASDYAVRSGKLNGSRYYPPPFNPETSEDVAGPLVASIRAAVADALPEEKKERYLAALEQQAEFRHAACLEAIMSRLEICLILSEEQRRQIAAALDENWNPKWEEAGTMQGVSHDGFPNIPSKLLEPYLDKDQLASWEARHKDSYFGWGIGGGEAPADIPWDLERHK